MDLGARARASSRAFVDRSTNANASLGARARPERRATTRARASDARRPSQGDVSKKPCDRCSGTGVVKCFECNDFRQQGWTIDGSTAKCDTPGMVPVTRGGVFGVGAKKIGERQCATCASSKTRGTITCSRCQGNKFLLYRNADWR